jgi:hypothetical protein
VIGRVRCRDGYRTGVFVANASGNLKYDMAAEVEIAAINHAGRRLSHYLTLPAFASQIVWLDDVMARLKEHVARAASPRCKSCRRMPMSRHTWSASRRTARSAPASLGLLSQPCPVTLHRSAPA